MLTYLYTLDYDDQDASEAVAMEESQNTDGHVTDSSSKPEVVDDATVVHCKRMNNVFVYALAEKYNIPALKELAATKFVGCEWPADFAQYQELVNAIFESTPDTDTCLRTIVTLDCVNPQLIEKVLEEEGLAPTIRDHGIFGLGMLREIVKKHNAKLETLNAELEMEKQDAKAREKDLVVELEGSNAKIQHLKAEQETKERGAQARENDLGMALAGSNAMIQNLNAERETKDEDAKARENDLGVVLEGLSAKIQSLNAEQETKEREALARAIELKVALGCLYHDAMSFDIPKEKDSTGAFKRFRQALGSFQQKLLDLGDSVKL